MIIDYSIVFGTDKWMHFFGYAGLSLLLSIIVILITRKHEVGRNVSYLWIILVTFGILDEYRQYPMPNRSAEFLDAVANIIGITVGLCVPLFVFYVIKFRNHNITKLFCISFIFLVPLLLGLIYINEIPFITLEEPLQDTIREVVAFILR